MEKRTYGKISGINKQSLILMQQPLFFNQISELGISSLLHLIAFFS